MSGPVSTAEPWTVELAPGPATTPELLCARRRPSDGAAVLLDGRGGFRGGWGGPLVACGPREVLRHRGAGSAGAGALERLARLVEERRAVPGTADTGIAVLAAYDLLDPAPLARRDDDGLPELVAIAVDRSARFLDDGRVRVTARSAPTGAPGPPADARATAEAIAQGLVDEGVVLAPPAPPAPARGVATSLPRAAYLTAVERVRQHIRAGDIYQANLCQRFEAPFGGDALDLYRSLALSTPAPRSAFVEVAGLALVSASPEIFLDVGPDGRIETRPIKGTRPRGADPLEDRTRAGELESSAKDRAELTMIVDLERNDLGRVCETGTVRVTELAGLESFPEVHHLVARVEGTLVPGTGVERLLGATFPGGSITGAPKRRVIEILRGLEPVRRSFFTGSLLWLGDDGSVRSSILIRTVVLAARRALVGAGGGVVIDSDPETEWRESNHKARAPARALGFEPEEAR